MHVYDIIKAINLCLSGNNSCSIQSRCIFLCLAAPIKPFFKCACPDNMKTVLSPSGAVSCECIAGESIVNGKCQTSSESRLQWTYRVLPTFCYLSGGGGGGEWPCNTPSKDSLKSKTNTTTGKTMLRSKVWITSVQYGWSKKCLLVFDFDEFSEWVLHGHCSASPSINIVSLCKNIVKLWLFFTI
jgi:hypothetical protein